MENNMGEIILGSVAESVAAQIGSLIISETGPVRGVRGDLEKLSLTVAPVTDLLRQAEKRQVEGDPEVRHWLEQLRDVIYDADDVLDDLFSESLRQGGMQGNRFLKEVRIFLSSSNHLLYSFMMARRIKRVRRWLDMIPNDGLKDHIQLLRSHGAEVLEDRDRQSAEAFRLEAEVILGREHEREGILQLLFDTDFEDTVPVLAIVGTGGIGKTSLASLLFNDEHVSEYFQLRLWVIVSTNFDLERLARNMLRLSSHRGHGDPDNMDEAAETLRQCFNGKRVLLVLDDAWEENARKWSELKYLMHSAEKESRIVVTTRGRNVARAAGAQSIYELGSLSLDESVSLLMRVAQTEKHERWGGESLMAIAREIAYKCAGVPLLLKTVGRILRSSRSTVEEWLRFSHLDFSKLDEYVDPIMPILRLSYSSLPSHLKQCFAYCSLFPTGYRFDPHELIDLWISQGYVKPLLDTGTLEEIGRSFLLELVSRSFFTEIEEDVDGNVIGCQMNLSMTGLAKGVAGNQCFMLDPSNDEEVLETALHVSTHLEHFDLEKVGKMNKLRTFLLLDDHPGGNRGPSDWGKFFLRLKKLRALRLRGVHGLRNVSKSIGRLRHLRHLDLSNNGDIAVLPASLSKLHNLETLNLEGCCQLKQLPNGMSELASLRHLYTRGCDNLSHMFRGIEKLTCLQTLCEFVVGKTGNTNIAVLSELSRLNGLKDLAVRHLEREGGEHLNEPDASCLENKSNLQSLELQWEHSADVVNRASEEGVLERLRPHPNLKRFMVKGYGGDRFPAWASQLENLVRLEIRGCPHCKYLPSLEHLHKLRTFCMLDMPDLEYISLSGGVESSFFFPSLERLELKNLPEFKGWKRMGDNKDEVDVHEDCDLIILTVPRGDEFQVQDCPRLSFWKGRSLFLWGVADRVLKKWVRSNSEGYDSVPRLAIISLVSVPLYWLESIEISNLVNVEYLPEELFGCLPDLHSLVIKCCLSLKALNGRKMLRSLSSLTKLEISMCPRLDLFTETGDQGAHALPLEEGQSKLVRLSIHNIPKMENLPGWIQLLPNLEDLSIRQCHALKALPQWMSSLTSLRTLQIDFCEGLKTLPRRVILQLFVNTLGSLEIKGCPQLDLSGEEDHEVFAGQGKLQKLAIHGSEKMQSLPWWTEHLSNLESLEMCYCTSMEALPLWFPKLTLLKNLHVRFCGQLSERCKVETGEDRPKISHVPNILIE